MDSKTNRPRRRVIRLDRAPLPVGDNWPVFDLELLTVARMESLLVARLRMRKSRWRLLPGRRD
ncbi:MAG TPA: hypothetical protein VEN81_00955 [Planctomycetota bacterium]|nr:hypothetical protein [Planctomycetota bacterium]